MSVLGQILQGYIYTILSMKQWAFSREQKNSRWVWMRSAKFYLSRTDFYTTYTSPKRTLYLLYFSGFTTAEVSHLVSTC